LTSEDFLSDSTKLSFFVKKKKDGQRNYLQHKKSKKKIKAFMKKK